jgi:hypothetical protein
MNIAYREVAAGRRLGILLTVLVHAALILGWQMARTPPPPPQADQGAGIQWIPLPAPRVAAHAPAPAREKPLPPQPRSLPLPALPSLSLEPVLPAATPATPAGAPAQATAPARSTGQILEQARRDIRGIDKALRKENKPYIVAPLDSPQIRLRKGIELANEMAPNRLWEAPKVEELVNNTGDGARRSRVISGGGTYCVTERSPATSIDMVEKHGKLRITNCPAHEAPATQQAWRTARD